MRRLLRQETGIGVVLTVFAAAAPASPVPVGNGSFEGAVGSIPTPLVSPPLSGAIGGWVFSRTAAGVVTGLTVPQMGIEPNPNATDGVNAAFVRFVAGITSSATITQDLGVNVQPGATYTLLVDVIQTDLLTVLPGHEIKVLGGGQVLASSANASLVTIAQLNGLARRYAIRFDADSSASGELKLELSAASALSVGASILFDNIALDARVSVGGCYANCDGSMVQPVLTANDFVCFINEFAKGQGQPALLQTAHYANCDGSVLPPVLTANDFVCYVNEYAQGCQ